MNIETNNYEELFKEEQKHELYQLQDENMMLKRKCEILEEKYRYAIRKLKMVALELEND
jgi:hypothetical protein